MSFQYSQKLIERTIKNFKEENGLDISVETASEYLDGLSGLFLAFARPSRAPRADGGQSEQSDSSMGASNTHRTL